MRIIKTVIGILLLPAAFALAQAFFDSMAGIGILSSNLRVMERGVLIYLVSHIMIVRPVYLYVLGHEFVHAITTWICGGKVISFNVTPGGGSCVTNKTNVFIELSPYFVPVYTILLGIIYITLRAIDKQIPHMSYIFLFLVGVTLAFHFVMTSEVLRMEQPDILKSGIILSFVFIFIGNLLIIALLFSPIFDSISFLDFLKEAFNKSKDMYVRIYSTVSNFITAHFATG